MTKDCLQAVEILTQDLLEIFSREGSRDMMDWNEIFSIGELDALANTEIIEQEIFEINDISAILLESVSEDFPQLRSIAEESLLFCETALEQTAKQKHRLSPAAVVGLALLLSLSVERADVEVSGIKVRIVNHPFIGAIVTRLVDTFATGIELRELKEWIATSKKIRMQDAPAESMKNTHE